MVNDQYGIKQIFKSKVGGKVWINPTYTRSTHNTGVRDTYAFSGVDKLPLEATLYVKNTISDAGDEIDLKFWGGAHTGSGDNSTTRQGRCYIVGITVGSGRPYIGKEYPHHPDGAYDVVSQIRNQAFPNIGDIRNKWVGIKGISYIKNGNPTIDVYLDTNVPVVAGLPQPSNNWRYWYSLIDDGTWSGERYLTNQGIANGGDGKFYLRMDDVTDKSPVYGMSIRELDTIPVLEGTVDPPVTTLAAPHIVLRQVNTSGLIELNWANVVGATKYETWARTLPNPVFIKLFDSTIGAQQIQLSQGASYEFKVFAANSTLRSAGSNVIAYTYAAPPPPPVPLQPPVLTGSISGNNVSLKWNSVSGATKYEVWGGASSVSMIKLKEITGTLGYDFVASAGTAYYKVFSANATERAGSNVISLTAGSVPPTGRSLILLQTTQGYIYVLELTNAEISAWEAIGGKVFQILKVRLKIIFADNTFRITEWLTLQNLRDNISTYNQIVKTGGKIQIVETATNEPPPSNLLPPTLSISSITNDNVTLEWTAVNGAGWYRLFKRSPLDSNFVEIRLGEVLTHNFVLTVEGDTRFMVRAETISQVSPDSNIVTANKGGGGGTLPLLAPVLSGTIVNGVAKLNWNAITGASWYRVFKRINTGSWNEVQLDPKRTYETPVSVGQIGFMVRAENITDVSPDSNVVLLVVEEPPDPPLQTPTIFKTQLTDKNMYVISWNTINGATSFDLESKLGTSTNWLVENLFPEIVDGKHSIQTSIDRFTAKKEFRVRAKNATQTSGYSNVIAIDYIDDGTQTLPPPILQIIKDNNNLTLKWSAITGATGYRLEAKNKLETEWRGSSVTTRLEAFLYLRPENAGTTQFRVRAFNQTEFSAWSNIVEAAYIPPDNGGGGTKPERKDLISKVANVFTMASILSIMGDNSK